MMSKGELVSNLKNPARLESVIVNKYVEPRSDM